MTRHYADSTSIAVPLGVLRALVAAADAGNGRMSAEVESAHEAALDWFAKRPLYREEVLEAVEEART